MKLLILGIVLLVLSFDIWMQMIASQGAKTIDPRTTKIYEPEKYREWLQYKRESVRLSLYQKIISFVILTLLLTFNIHSLFYNLVVSWTANPLLLIFFLILGIRLLEVPFSLYFKYLETFKIEEKYGFNRQTKGLFIRDFITKEVLTLVFSTVFVYLLWLIYELFDLYFIFYGLGLIFALLFIAMLVMPLFQKLFNKFTPLEEGTLRDGIFELMEKANFKVKTIQVIDASKRSSKSNAYFTGFGKSKRIVLYDTIKNDLNEEELLAVLAHELAHAKHRDMLKMFPLQILNLLAIIAPLYVLTMLPEIAIAFGFTDGNFFFSLILTMELAWPLLVLFNIPLNLYARKAEYRADRFAAQIYEKEAVKSALTIIHTKNFADLNPHPFFEFINYNHPSFFKRIDALDAIIDH